MKPENSPLLGGSVVDGDPVEWGDTIVVVVDGVVVVVVASAVAAVVAPMSPPRDGASSSLSCSTSTTRRLPGEYRSSQIQQVPMQSMAPRYVPVESQLTATTGLALVHVALSRTTNDDDEDNVDEDDDNVEVGSSYEVMDSGRDEGHDN
jgi:hypothetical protein